MIIWYHHTGCCMQEMGGAKYHFMTHQDDVAGHDQWHTALNTERIIHHTEANASQHTECVPYLAQALTSAYCYGSAKTADD